MKRTCIQCHNVFELTDGEIAFYQSKNMSLPKRCKACREKNRAGSESRQTERTDPEQEVFGRFGKKINANSGLKRTAWLLLALLAVVVFSVFSSRNDKPAETSANNGGSDAAYTLAVETKTDGATAADAGQSAAALRFRNEKTLREHYKKHGIEMDFDSPEAYVAAANAVVNNPAALHKNEKEDGDDVYFLEDTGEIVFVSTDGYLRTYFLSDLDYFNRQ